MRLPIFQVDAFSDRVFKGNPAAVVPLDAWIDDALMQSIALENNLSETAFFVREGDGFRIRWFTPTNEVPLCGHATLASAWVIFHLHGGDSISFSSASGPLRVTRSASLLALDFPAYPLRAFDGPRSVVSALGGAPRELLARDRLVFAVFDDEAAVRAVTPDFAALKREDYKALITAPGTDVDFVSRFFAPSEGIDEDPVTGSAHCSLIPYWAARLGKTALRAKQVSRRSGSLTCELRGDRVSIAGHAVRYLEGFIEV